MCGYIWYISCYFFASGYVESSIERGVVHIREPVAKCKEKDSVTNASDVFSICSIPSFSFVET